MTVRPHGTTLLPMDEFSWNLIFGDFSKIFRETEVSLKSDKNKGYFTWRPVYIFIISRAFLLRMGNVSDKRCRENQKTHFVFSNFSSNIVPFMRKCGKRLQSGAYCTESGLQSALHLHTVRLFTEGDDTRGCGDTIGPPDYEQRAARNMLRSVV